MSEALRIIRDAVLVAIGGGLVTVFALVIRTAYKKHREKTDGRFALYAKRDELLAENHRLLVEIGGNVRCLYQIQLPQLDALEVSLMALHGEYVNGNVAEALKNVRKAKKQLTDKMLDKIDCADLGGAD